VAVARPPRDRGTTDRPGWMRSLAGRAVWGVADQAVSSLTNFVVGLVVAQKLAAPDFGIFALVWATYGLALSVSRGMVSDPYVVRFSGASGELRDRALRRATGCALAVGLVTGGIGVGCGLLIGGPFGYAIVALGVVLPALLLQDAWRFGFFAAGEGARACVNDAVWAVALVPLMLLATAYPSVGSFVLAWGGGAAVAAAVGAGQARVLPALTGARAWLVEQRDLGTRYVLEALSNNASGQVRLYGVGILAGLTAVGALRGAELLIAPFLALLMGMSLVSVPEASRVLQRDRSRLPGFCLFLGSAQAVAALLWGLSLLLLVPRSVLVSLLGAIGPAAVPLVLPATLAITFASFGAGATTGLRALGAARRSLRAQNAFSAAYIVCTLTGAALDGALGSSWGAAVACLAGSVIWWTQLRAAAAEPATAGSADASSPVDELQATAPADAPAVNRRAARARRRG
jgi:O-antigen/teichoic acid export membrane protein